MPFAVLFLLLAATAGFALTYEDGALQSTAAFFAIAAEAVWSARSLSPERLLPGIAVYAVFGLFYLGVPILARRLGRRLPPAGSGAFLLLLSLGLLFFLAAGPLAASALWGLALLLVILNAGLFLEAGTLRRPALALAGTILSWILIGVWWATVPLTASLVPALFLVAGFAVLGLAGNLWMGRREGKRRSGNAGQRAVPGAGRPRLPARRGGAAPARDPPLAAAGHPRGPRPRDRRRRPLDAPGRAVDRRPRRLEPGALHLGDDGARPLPGRRSPSPPRSRSPPSACSGSPSPAGWPVVCRGLPWRSTAGWWRTSAWGRSPASSSARW